MSKSITIPEIGADPLVVRIDGQEPQEFQAGETYTVSNEVAAVIENILASFPQEGTPNVPVVAPKVSAEDAGKILAVNLDGEYEPTRISVGGYSLKVEKDTEISDDSVVYFGIKSSKDSYAAWLTMSDIISLFEMYGSPVFVALPIGDENFPVELPSFITGDWLDVTTFSINGNNFIAGYPMSGDGYGSILFQRDLDHSNRLYRQVSLGGTE